MKVQKINLHQKFLQKNNGFQRNTAKESPTKENLQIYSGNVKMPCPVIITVPVSVISADDDETFKARSAIFRDDELFDEEKDFQDAEYRKYDSNDLINYSKPKLHIPEEYYMAKGSKFNINKEYETILAPIDPNNLENEPDNGTLDIEHGYVPHAKELDELSYLNKAGRPIYSFALNDALIEKAKDNYSIQAITTVTNSSKLTDSDGNEHFDSALFEKGFNFVDNVFLGSLYDVESLMRSSVLVDREKKEVYSPDTMQFMQRCIEILPLEDTIKLKNQTIKSDRINGQYFDRNRAKKLLEQLNKS